MSTFPHTSLGRKKEEDEDEDERGMWALVSLSARRVEKGVAWIISVTRWKKGGREGGKVENVIYDRALNAEGRGRK